MGDTTDTFRDAINPLGIASRNLALNAIPNPHIKGFVESMHELRGPEFTFGLGPIAAFTGAGIAAGEIQDIHQGLIEAMANNKVPGFAVEDIGDGKLYIDTSGRLVGKGDIHYYTGTEPDSRDRDARNQLKTSIDSAVNDVARTLKGAEPFNVHQAMYKSYWGKDNYERRLPPELKGDFPPEGSPGPGTGGLY